MKRLDWEEYFLGLVQLSAQRSEDPNTKVGAVIVNNKNRIVGIGYNGMPDGLEFNWNREGDLIDTKYPYVIHAEMNALLNTTSDINGSRVYVSLFPCSNCAKHLTQAGVKEVIYIEDKYHDTDDAAVSRKILETAGVKFKQGKNIKIEVK